VAGGGTGKTRLAYEAAVAMRDRFPDGIFAIELADGGAPTSARRASWATRRWRAPRAHDRSAPSRPTCRADRRC
jgi:hypothetical protein